MSLNRAAIGLLTVICGVAPSPSARAGVETVQLPSKALGGPASYAVYLPPGHAVSNGQVYPVIVALHGLGGGPMDLFDKGGLSAALDRLIGSGEVMPVVVIAPDGGDGYWVDHLPAPGANTRKRYAAFVLHEVIPDASSRFRLADRRAVAGLSMGGFGALSIALQHPERFVAVVSLSGALFDRAPTHRKVYHRAWGNPPDQGHWRRISPQILLGRVARAKVPALYLHCGDDDRLGFLELTLQAHKTLVKRKIPHELRVVDGGHGWDVWRAETDAWVRFVDRSFRAAAAAEAEAKSAPGQGSRKRR